MRSVLVKARRVFLVRLFVSSNFSVILSILDAMEFWIDRELSFAEVSFLGSRWGFLMADADGPAVRKPLW